MKIRKKSLFVLLMVVVVTIGCVLYLPVEQNSQAKNVTIIEEINLPKKGEFQTPLVFLSIYINDLDNEEENPIGYEVFGFRKGSVLSDARVISEFELSSGTSLYGIDPLLDYDSDVKFYATASKKDKLIESIRAIHTTQSLEEAMNEKKELEELILQKFHLVFEDNDFKYYKNEYGDLIITYLKAVNDVFELRLHFLANLKRVRPDS